MPDLEWDKGAWNSMLRHCAEEVPREACGALLGRLPGNVDAVVPMTNVEPSDDHYRVAPEEQLALFESLDENPEVELLGWYHSHPRTSSEPSELDRQLAVPGFIYVVVGPDDVTAFTTNVRMDDTEESGG